MKNFNTVKSFYCFTHIEKKYLDDVKNILLNYEKEGLTGLVIIAEEGINGTICGTDKIINKTIEFIKKYLNNQDLNEKLSFSKNKVFKKLKIKIKSEIVTMGISNFNPSKSGTYVSALEWNKLLKDKKTLVIDTRNHYEVSLGSFNNSINPKTKNFREFPKWVEKYFDKYVNEKQIDNIAMFCTGGIRCEKATSLLTEKGFKNIYHLKGGILKYLEIIPPKDNLYEGECYVFDERVALNNHLKKGSYTICHACGMPLSLEDKTKKEFIEGVQCHLCIKKFSDADRIRFAERQRQIEQQKTKSNLS
tara:strand:- start:678 stop:1592 length:915 start_codon:yes stop_codon:yes gene_type:complete